MKQLTCEMCGSTDLIKQDGVFVCQYCGAKYSIEEAKKMMVEGTVKIDNTDQIENLLIRAQQFEKENQVEKALEYYNRVLDIDARNQYAKERIAELTTEKPADHFYIGTVMVQQDAIDYIDACMAEGRKLDAIKYIRETTNLGLADTKTWVENYKTYDLTKKQTLTLPASSGGCYVATCVYGSYDCPQVWTLRRFRDDTLGATWYGRALIRTYYAISPTLVKWFGETSWFKRMWHGTLDRMVVKLNSDGVADTPYQDKDWR